MKWITRERPKIDRIACPWLIARFIDKAPEFLYVPADQVMAVAAQTGAVPYDVPGVEMGHVGEHCSFDAFMKKYALADPALPLLRDTLAGLKEGGHTDLTAQAAALFACLAFDRPFFDGHARVAFAATDVFLRINGYRVGRNPQSLLADLTRMTRDPGGARLVDPWLRGLVSPADSSAHSS